MNTAQRLLLAASLLLLAPAGALQAQNYRFQVELLELEVFVLPDASARLKYKITFVNQPGAHAIDVVDVGLPHENYSIGSMTASVDGQTVRPIRKSKYVDVGVEVHLGAKTIAPGQTGTFEFQCVMPEMVYQDTTDGERASLQIKPTWFDSQLQVGATELRIAVHLPPGVKPEEVKYHEERNRYQELAVFGQGKAQHVVAVWDYSTHRLSSNNPKVGISFPKRDMTRVVKMSAFGLLVKWFSERPRLRFFVGGGMVVLLAVLFFRFSHGTGWILFILMAVGIVWLMTGSPGFQLVLLPALLGMLGLNEWYLRHRRQRGYLPAIASVEGGGIKRGLTAPEAAVLLKMPLSKVLTLVIFGLLKKGLVRSVSLDPLQVEVPAEYRCPRGKRRKVASANGTVIRGYEQSFLDRLLSGGKPVKEHDLNGAIGLLIKNVVRRMKGFDVDQTREYYRRIVSRAWTEAESIGEVELRTKMVDRNLEWLMMDPTWDDRFGRWGQGGYTYRPVWVGGRSGSSGGASTPVRPPTSQTSFREVASSFVGMTENVSGQLASAIEPASMGLDLPKGVVNLTSVDTGTTNFFDALASSSGGGGGGGGGGCACACAGCACACACAGGGR